MVNKHALLKKRVIKQRQIPYMNSTLRRQNPAAYHVGAFYLTGNKRKTYDDVVNYTWETCNLMKK